MDRTDSTFSDLKDRQNERARRRQRLRARRESERRPGWITRRRLDRAANGIEGQPVGSVRQSRVLIASAEWAPHIRGAARAFRHCPGLDVLDERPLPDHGLGFEAGRRIFELAAQGASVETITMHLEEARLALGPWGGEWEDASPSTSDSEVGIWGFFRQLHRYWSGRRWNPPLPRRIVSGSRKAHREPLAPHPFDPAKAAKALSEGSRRMLAALSDEYVSSRVLAQRLCSGSDLVGTVRSWAAQIRKAGFPIESKRGKGYRLRSK